MNDMAFSNSAIASIATFAFVSLTVYLISTFSGLVPYQKTLRNRIHSMTDKEFDDEPNRSVDLGDANQKVSKWTSGTQSNTLVPSLLNQAGIYAPSAIFWFYAVSIGCVVTVAIIGFFLYLFYPSIVSPSTLILLASASIGSWFIPRVWLARAIKRRHLVLNRSIPDFLELMIICFDAGLSLPYTLKRVASELQLARPELADELIRIQHDTEMGASLDLALSNFAQRTNFDGLKSICVLVREVNRFGSDITQALRDHADHLILQREMSAEEKAQKATVKILFPILLFILPAVFVVVAGPAFIQLSTAFSKAGP